MESPACRKYSVSGYCYVPVLCAEEIPQRDERDSDAGSAVGDMSGSHDEHFYQMKPDRYVSRKLYRDVTGEQNRTGRKKKH